MICENTVSAGFYFMLGKFLFDAAVFVAVVGGCFAFWLAVDWLNRRGRKK